MTLALPSKTRPFTEPRQSPLEPQVTEAPAAMPISRLDRVLNGLKHDHRQHGEGPVFPCPLCFDPPLRAR